MYKLQLIRKYLLKRRIAWVALVAVMLCTAMVLIVVSVMGGWLRNFKGSFHGMTGDVIVSAKSLAGFPEYQQMIDQIRQLPEVAGAVPVIRTGALINIDNQEVSMVQVLGFPPDIGTVNDWPSTLHLDQAKRKQELLAATTRPSTTAEEKKRLEADIAKLPFSLHPDVDYQYLVPRNPELARNRPGIIVTGTLVGLGRAKNAGMEMYRQHLYELPVTLTMVPVVGHEQINMESVQPVPFWIVDDSKSRIFAMDNNDVYISFDEAQRDLRMSASEDGGARCSEIEIKARPGTDLDALKVKVIAITDKVRDQYSIPDYYGFRVQTWIDQQGAFIKAVENEVSLTTVLFGIISMVAVLLIFCIFYMIVVEKTKDIGIIKSVGATGAGILGLFLGYGLAIGVVGAAFGFGFAFYFVKYINELHAWLGREFGIVIWTPDTYQFDKIPNQMETRTVIWVLVAAVLSAVFGAMIPAIRAAGMNPVDALKYE
jgi:lipoprotein-releasing system permease protein